MYIWIIGIVVVLIIIYGLIENNKFIKLNNQVKEAFATMDVYLKKRWDLIPNLVEVVKGYSTHEKDTLENVMRLRNTSYEDMSNTTKLEVNNKINYAINVLMAITEKYPELKANDNFKNLSNELLQVENDIANSRKYYNGAVRLYNNKVEMFPSNLVAKVLGYKTQKMFEANSDERNNVKVEL